jgi:GT2 family glycosyltransferase
MNSGWINLSIVIVTWNARDYTWQCLKSLQQQVNVLSSEIIVVDNHSSDGTLEMIKQAFPQVQLVSNHSNLGFAKGNNIGIQRSRGKYICLINSDVEILPECLPNMYSYMEQNPEIGVLGPRMRGRNGQVGRSYMRFPTVWNCLCNCLALDSIFNGIKLFAGTMMKDFRNDHTSQVDVLNGWFLMVRREALDAVGLLDERFFMYGEDVDWSYRFRKAGWKLIYFAGAEAIHYGGASSANAPTRFYVEMQRANVQFWRKNHGRISTFVYLQTIWLHHVVRVLGYGAIYCFRKSARNDASSKIRRSMACLNWLLHWRSGRLVAL